MTEPVKKDLLDMLVCPLGKAKLRSEGDKLVCTRCGLRFPVRHGIPVMLVDEAELPPGCQCIEDLPCYTKDS